MESDHDVLSPSTQANVLIFGQLSFQRSTEAITPSRTFIEGRPAGAPQASTVLRRRLGSAVEVEDSKTTVEPSLAHPPSPSRTLFLLLDELPTCWGLFLTPQYWVTFWTGPDKAQCVGFLSGTLRISLGPHRLMGVLNMMIMSRIGAERGWGEEKGVINQVATWGKKMLLLTFRGQSLV